MVEPLGDCAAFLFLLNCDTICSKHVLQFVPIEFSISAPVIPEVIE